jgi:hypothetical protein
LELEGTIIVDVPALATLGILANSGIDLLAVKALGWA